MEGSLVAYKVFTNGSVLQASELNENLMQQAVATFSNAAARTAAITSPVEGQLTYLLDVNRYDHWNGTAWVSPFGLTLINTTSFTSATTVAVDNVFTSAYQNYQIVIEGTGSSAAGCTMQLRVGGVASVLTYNWSGLEVTTGAGPTRQGAITQPSWKIGTITDNFTGNIQIANPNLARRTNFISTNAAYSSSLTDNWTSYFTGGHNTATAYDGFQIISASPSISGTIRTYGLRNAA
jgi:hypothetical protein